MHPAAVCMAARGNPMKKLMVLAIMAAVQPSALLAQDNQAAAPAIASAAVTPDPATTSASPTRQSPAPDQTPVDPARLARATRLAELMMPEGSYAEMMSGAISSMADSIMPMLTTMSGASGDKDSKGARILANPQAGTGGRLNNDLIRRVMAIMGEEMAPIAAAIEPQMRAGIAQAMARRFDDRQLASLDSFFRTPTGAAYARQSISLLMDPSVMQASMEAMPRLMERMPTIMRRVQDEVGIADAPTNTNQLAADKSE